MNVKQDRQGQMDIASCYFYTDTIYDFKHLKMMSLKLFALTLGNI